MARNQCQRRDVYKSHFLVTIRIALRKRTTVAESSVIDQEIDFEFLAIEPVQKGLQLPKIGKINFSNVNKKLRMLSLQLISKFDQPFITPCDQNQRTSTIGELACKFATDPSRSSSDQRITIVEFHCGARPSKDFSSRFVNARQ